VWRERQNGRTKTLKGPYLLVISWEGVDPKIVMGCREVRSKKERYGLKIWNSTKIREEQDGGEFSLLLSSA
jgi:hypothetical protein